MEGYLSSKANTELIPPNFPQFRTNSTPIIAMTEAEGNGLSAKRAYHIYLFNDTNPDTLCHIGRRSDTK